MQLPGAHILLPRRQARIEQMDPDWWLISVSTLYLAWTTGYSASKAIPFNTLSA